MSTEQLNSCDILLETYNTSILDSADEELKKSLLEEAKKCADGNPDKGDRPRNVLAKLIINHSIQNDQDVEKKYKKPVVTSIAGPYTLTVHWNEKFKKLIYIFGEQHSTETDCDDELDDDDDDDVVDKRFVGKYLYTLIKNTDVFIDFYVELNGFKGEKYETLFSDSIDRNLNIMFLGKYFQECIQKSTRDTKDDCKLSRSHYFDIRSSEGIKLNDVSLFNKDLHTLLPTLMKNNLRDHTLKQNIDIFLDFFNRDHVERIFKANNEVEDFSGFLTFWFSQIDQFDFLMKKINRSTIDVREIIKSYVKEEIKIRILEIPAEDGLYWSDYDKIFKKIHTKYYNEQKSSYDFSADITKEENIELLYDLIKIHDYFILINSLIPDGYLLARVFKEFNNEDLEKRRPTDEPKNPHNIIIYAGDAHANRYRKFLEEKLDFKLLEQAGVPWRIARTFTGKFKNCIEMKTVKQPFFSNYPEFKVDWLTSKPPNLPKNTETEWKEKTADDGKVYYEKEGMQISKPPPDYYMSSKIKKNPDSVWKEAVKDGELYYQHNIMEKIKQKHLPFDFYISVDPEYREIQRSESGETDDSMDF